MKHELPILRTLLLLFSFSMDMKFGEMVCHSFLTVSHIYEIHFNSAQNVMQDLCFVVGLVECQDCVCKTPAQSLLLFQSNESTSIPQNGMVGN